MIGCRVGCTALLSRFPDSELLCARYLRSQSLLELARTARKSFPGLKASDSTIRCNRQVGPLGASHLRTPHNIRRNGAPLGRCNYS